jgi:putative glutamine amidotransferase
MNAQAKRPIIGCLTYQKEASERALHVVGLMPSYIEAVRRAGGIPVLIPLLLDEAEMQAALERMDGVLIPGGGDMEPARFGGIYHPTMYGIDPLRDEFEINLVRHTVKQQKPVLAICRGIQVFNVALGGTLWEDVGSMMPDAVKHDYYQQHPRNYLAHTVDITADSCLAHYLQTTKTYVNSLHHQGIRKLAPDVRATAVAPDGLIEAIEIPSHPFAIGVQWHPENLVHDDPSMLRLFEGLVEAAQSH